MTKKIIPFMPKIRAQGEEVHTELLKQMKIECDTYGYDINRAEARIYVNRHPDGEGHYLSAEIYLYEI